MGRARRFHKRRGEGFVRSLGSTHGFELWRSDGTRRRTKLVRDINPGYRFSVPKRLTKVSGKVFLAARDRTHGLDFRLGHLSRDLLGRIAESRWHKRRRPARIDTNGVSDQDAGDGLKPVVAIADLGVVTHPFVDDVRAKASQAANREFAQPGWIEARAYEHHLDHLRISTWSWSECLHRDP